MNAPDQPSTVGLEGQISIRFTDTVTIRSSRPLSAAQLLRGKTPQQASEIVPLLFNVCGVAQSTACKLALAVARAEFSDMPSSVHQRILVLVENARESILRLLRDMPALVQTPSNADIDYMYIGKLVATFKNAAQQAETSNDAALLQEVDLLDQFLSQHVFGSECHSFSTIADIDSLQHWVQTTNTAAAQITRLMMQADWRSQGHHEGAFSPLPDLDLNAVARQLRSEDSYEFISQPKWQGNCHETGSLARQSGHTLLQRVQQEYGTGILARWLARLLDLASIPHSLRLALNGDASACFIETEVPGEGCGIAAVEAARGRLIHMAYLEDDCIADYKILAPTEWNFHPDGVVAGSLAAIDSTKPDQRLQMAHVLIHTIDPCVTYQLEAA